MVTDMEQIEFGSEAARTAPAVQEVNGGFPFEGACFEDGAFRDVGGNLKWRALVPDVTGDDQDMEFITFMFMNMDPGNPMENVVSDYPLAVETRIGFDFLERINESCDHETKRELLDMHVNGRPGYSERFDVSPACQDP